MSLGQEQENKALAQRLRAWRIINGWTQGMAAEYLSVNRRTYEAWEVARRMPVGIGRIALISAINSKPTTKAA